VIDVTEILMHWHAGRFQLQLAARLGWIQRRSVSTSPRRWRRGWPRVGLRFRRRSGRSWSRGGSRRTPPTDLVDGGCG